jgi:hypothetical protein
MAHPADGIVDFALGDSFVVVRHLADLMTDLFGENTQAEPWSQHAFEDLRLLFHRKRHEPSPQLGNLGIIDLGWKSHGPSVLIPHPPCPCVSLQVTQDGPGAVKVAIQDGVVGNHALPE